MIVITTPTGAIGQQVLARVLGGTKPVRVIARDPSKLAADARERAEVIEGSHGDKAVASRAFAGADAVFWLPPPNPKFPSLEAAFVDFTRPAAEAIREQGVSRVVSVSALGRGTPQAARAGLVTASLAMDDVLAATGAHFRALVMPSFMDNLLRQKDVIRDKGMFFSTIAPDRKLPTCATRDIAAAAARLLLDDSWTGQAEGPVLGPEDLSHDDMARILSDVLGKPVRYQQIPLDALQAQFRQNGMSEAFVQGYADMMSAKDQGLDNAAPRTPETSTPTSFRQWCEEVLKPALAR